MDSDQLTDSCVQTLYGRDSAAQALGIVLVESGPGRAKLGMRVRQDMCNGHGICHGGILFALADTAMAYASNSYGLVAVASSAHIDYLSSVPCGEFLSAQAEEVYRGRRKGSYQVSLRNQSKILVVNFYGSVAFLSRKVLEQSTGDSE